MPLRTFNRQQAWLLPPTLGDLVPEDHPSRFVGTFLDALDQSQWLELGVNTEGEALGAPAYHPKALLAVWLYGFMMSIRSSRKLEIACRDQLPFLWLTAWQRPDHNTICRFYRDHRHQMHHLLKYTVATAVESGLADLALQSLDGTKVAANAAGDRTYDAEGLARLLARVEVEIADLETQNEEDEGSAIPALPKELQQAQALKQRVEQAIDRLKEEGICKINLTDNEAQLMKGRSGIMPGFNAQAMVSPLRDETGTRRTVLVTATDVVNDASDSGELAPMLERTESVTGQRANITLADGGYHTVAALEAAHDRGQTLVMGERYHDSCIGPYFKDKFECDRGNDSYICPAGQMLPFRSIRRSKVTGLRTIRVYRASRTSCRNCSAFGVCTKDKHAGRALWVTRSDELLQKHRQWMRSVEARALYTLRRQFSEPAFGILKEQMNGRRFLSRGLANVRAEFSLMATAFNLRSLRRLLPTARIRAASTRPQ
jgi:transposase